MSEAAPVPEGEAQVQGDGARRRRRRRRNRRGPRPPGSGDGQEAQASEPAASEARTEPAAEPPPASYQEDEEMEDGPGGRRKRRRRRRHRHRAGRHARRRGGRPPSGGQPGGPELDKSKAKFAGNWWADRWIKMLESFGHSNRLPRGRYYARTGRVFDFRVGPGEVTAKVQGSRPQPYSVRIEVAPLDERAWGRVIEAMASQAVFAAKMLSGEMPQNIGEVFASASVSLFPKMARDLKMTCSCPDSANLCKHAVAVNYILAEAFDGDPFILLHLRGRSRDEVIDALTVTRARLVSPEAEQQPSANGEDESAEAEGPPSSDLYKFYEIEHTLEDMKFTLEAPPAPHAVLSSLGPPPVHNPAQGEAVLAACYSLVSQQALDVAYGRESEGKPETPVPVAAPKPASTAPSITSTQVSLRSIRE